LGNLSAYPNAVRWSAIDNPLDWPEPGSNDAQYKQADIQIFPGGGAVQAIATGMSAYEGLVFCETSIYRAQYVGSPYIFQFTAVDKNRGTIAPRSVIQASNYVYFLSEDGFYATDGAQVRNIGLERVNLWWRDNSDENRRHETMAVYNPVAGVVAWAFASSSCPPDRFDRLMIFHPELNRFSLVYQDVELIYTDASRGLTLEDLDAYGPLDELTFSLDSKGLKGGVAVLGAFNIEHKTVLFAGKAREAALETVEKGGTGMFIHGVRPIIDGAEASVVLLHRNFQKDTLQVLNCAAPSKRDGIAYGRCSTRYARAQVHIPAGVDWTHAQGVEVYYEEEGNI
ncbi:hypothetical protein LJB93_03090, partial [Desulfovibrio sp. OttesenSCG-928-F07]|nr:hypothetical protein [Desulfovibrio sp. OttesenSCG-928-F07]